MRPNQMQFINGATVTRVHQDGSSELLAAFQHFPHAQRWAKSMAEDETQPRNYFFVAVDHYRGDLDVYRQSATAKPAGLPPF